MLNVSWNSLKETFEISLDTLQLHEIDESETISSWFFNGNSMAGVFQLRLM